MSIEQWLPVEDNLTLAFISDCQELDKLACVLETRFASLLSNNNISCWKEECSVAESLLSLCQVFDRLANQTSLINSGYKVSHWRSKTWHHRLTLLYLLNQVIAVGLATFITSEEHLPSILRLVVLYNDLLALSLPREIRVVTVVKNTCPSLLQPLRKLSTTKILQLVAQQRAKRCAVEFIDVLLALHYDIVHRSPSPSAALNEDDLPSSENSSMEIYRALTIHLSPPPHKTDIESPLKLGEQHRQLTCNVTELECLLHAEEKRLATLLTVMAQTTPLLLGPHAVKVSKSKGIIKARKRVKQKVLDYYQQVLWGEVGAYTEHIVLWWEEKSIGCCEPQLAHHLYVWLQGFIASASVSDLVKPALHCLKDSLSCHVTCTMWDQQFRKALVAAGYQHSRHKVLDTTEGTWTGQLLCDTLCTLVGLCNDCEGSNWSADQLEELPVVEQIPILHRLDHSLHTVRLWAVSKATHLAHAWHVGQFLRVIYSDVNACLQTLQRLQLANNVDLLGPTCSVHVTVCTKMRAKLVSEVQENIHKLQCVPSECINILATLCRTYCLANLQMFFPDASYWRLQLDEIPQFASCYVEEYLDKVLKPLLVASNVMSTSVQLTVSGLALCIMCEAWLDHIYTHRIKFSEWGSMQLLIDFGAVPTWLAERVSLRTEVRRQLVGSEVLRRCEGVGRLLLRRPGEHIPMCNIPPRSKHVDMEDATSPPSPDSMPAEMYVPNQEQWLELRAQPQNKTFMLCCASLWQEMCKASLLLSVIFIISVIYSLCYNGIYLALPLKLNNMTSAYNVSHD